MMNKEIIERYSRELWAEQDFSAIDRTFSEDAIIHSPLNRTKGRVTMREMATKWLEAFPDLTFTWVDHIAEGDKVVSRWHAIGTHIGSFWDTHPTNKEIAFSGITTYRLHNGRVVEYWALVDMHAILRQLEEYQSIHEVVE